MKYDRLRLSAAGDGCGYAQGSDFGRRCPSNAVDLSGSGVAMDDLYANAGPPRSECALDRREVYGDGAVGGCRAGDMEAEIYAAAEVVGFAIILVEIAGAIVTGEDAESERAVGPFVRGLDERGDGQDSTGANIDGKVA